MTTDLQVPRTYQRRLKRLARELRAHPTDAERALWRHLRMDQIHGVRFYRQRPLAGYIVDFYAPAARLVVEIDGGHHFLPGPKQRDEARTHQLAKFGLVVLRFDNRQVLTETESVVEKILGVVLQRTGGGNPS